ncbi:hypothetical protein Gohar_007352 [Gossypium harknessii]|uniref:Uncharacterized protein n=1 Tax=Gossypium harknessii TaxID=34285 RepID=A0A7J9GG99_9ROSI|nr:hypothetical protein [Gossypium harknessii]
MKVKSYYDNLVSCGEIISDNEHVTVILNGLSLKYEPVITFITTGQVPYSVQGVTTMLLDAEARHASCVGKLVTLLIDATIALMCSTKVLVIDLLYKRMPVNLVMWYRYRRGCLPSIHL